MRTSHVALTTTAAILAGAAATASAGAVMTTRVVGGQPVATAQVPSIAALVESGAPAGRGQFCGATVIAARTVLTAAHCVEDATAASVEVITGRGRLSDERSGQRTRVVRIDIHPDWRSRFTDAALLHLAGPVSAPAMALSGPAGGAAGLPALVAGWGLTSASATGSASDDLRSTILTIRPAATCRAAHGSDYDDARMLCASAPGRDSCQGDSGGPLVTTTGGEARLAGIVSFGGERCADPAVPGVYTRVSAIAGWAGVAPSAPAPVPSPAARPPAPPARPAVSPRARIGRIACGPTRCRIDVRVSGSNGVDAVRIRVRREASGSRGAFTATVLARRVAGDRFRASVRVPDGTIRLTATPVRAGGGTHGRSDRETIELS